jgi:periplasmic divalent cation tolerance protein
MSEAVQAVLITAPDAEVGASLAGALVEEGLAACVNLVPGVRSIYRWEGAVQDDTEVLLIAKTREALLPALTARVGALHPYDVPEVIALPITGGSEPYLTWLRAASQVQA